MDIQRVEVLIAIMTGVVALAMQIWSRYDESRRDKKMIHMDERRFVLDEARTDTEITSQQQDVHMRTTEALSREMNSLYERLERITERASRDSEEIKMLKTSLVELFDEIEAELANGLSVEVKKKFDPIVKKLRQIRREYSI